MHDGGEHPDPHDERTQDEAHHHQGDAGIAGLGLTEDAHPVGDGLCSRQGRATRGERLENDEQRRPVAAVPTPSVRSAMAPGWCSEWVWSCPSTARTAPTTIKIAMLAMKKYVGRGEDSPGLADAAQVAVGDEDDERHR